MPDEDSHLAVHARSQAHDSRLKIAGMTEETGTAAPGSHLFRLATVDAKAVELGSSCVMPAELR